MAHTGILTARFRLQVLNFTNSTKLKSRLVFGHFFAMSDACPSQQLQTAEKLCLQHEFFSVFS